VPLSILLNMMFSLWLFKVVIAVLDTPFVYLGVSLVRKYVSTDHVKLMGYIGTEARNAEVYEIAKG